MIEDKNFNEGKIIINGTQIGNSACIEQVGDNEWIEDLGYMFIKYYYDENGKDLMIEWENKEEQEHS